MSKLFKRGLTYWYICVCIVHFLKKNPYPPHGRSSQIPRGMRVLEAKILEANYEAKLEPSVGGVWIFSGTAHYMYWYI